MQCMRIDLNLEDTYDIEIHNSDLMDFSFNSPVVGGGTTRIVVKIRLVKDPFLKDFINLSYGPLIEIDGETIIDDFATVPHINLSKVLSTVLLCGLRYLKSNPDKFIGINGSDFRRAYLYFRVMQRNLNYLSTYFELLGAKFFVRALRGMDKYAKLQIDSNELTYTPHSIDNMPLENHKSLYNYFLLYLK